MSKVFDSEYSLASGKLYPKLVAETVNVIYDMAVKYQRAAASAKDLNEAAALTEKSFKYFKRCLALEKELEAAHG